MSSSLETEIRQRLASVPFEGSAKSILDLDLVPQLAAEGGVVRLTLELPSPEHPRGDVVEREIRRTLQELPGVDSVEVERTWRVRETDFQKPKILGVKNVIAVASGKGGVGKSTVASNLATGLAQFGAPTGLLDLDIYGPSVPVIMGLVEEPHMSGPDRIEPSVAHGVKFLSMGQFARGDKAVLWRGPMLHKMVTQLAGGNWGELDYLVLDLPPGTGDVQLTLTQSMPLSGAIVVTTPQEIALIDARKGLTMFRDAKIPLLGIVENMSWYDCGKCGKRHALFGTDGGCRLAETENVPLLAQLPLVSSVRAAADDGRPIVLEDSEAGRAYRDLAAEVAAAVGARTLQRNPFKVLS